MSRSAFPGKARLKGEAASLEFRFDGRAQNSFLRNRIGLCTLHPIVECAGKACRVQHSDGSWEEGTFPLFISPHQPFKDIRALSWNPSERVHADIQFEGEVFEMEDQRNWTDASFKTYSTPLELPFPVELARRRRDSTSALFSPWLRRSRLSPPGGTPRRSRCFVQRQRPNSCPRSDCAQPAMVRLSRPCSNSVWRVSA